MNSTVYPEGFARSVYPEHRSQRVYPERFSQRGYSERFSRRVYPERPGGMGPFFAGPSDLQTFQPADHLFSPTYELPFPQPLCFHIHLRCRGGGVGARFLHDLQTFRPSDLQTKDWDLQTDVGDLQTKYRTRALAGLARV